MITDDISNYPGEPNSPDAPGDSETPEAADPETVILTEPPETKDPGDTDKKVTINTLLQSHVSLKFQIDTI